jgi:hypothetical protein
MQNGKIVDANDNEQTIETTDGHPFWVVTNDPDLSRAAKDYSDGMYHGNLEITENGFWVEAKDLRVGDVFLGANGELSTLTNIVRVEQDGGIAVFNFTVEGNHNYFILAKEYEYGQSCVLVHNADYNPSIPGRPFSGVDAPKDAFAHLEKYHGIPEHVSSNRLHVIKASSQLKAADDVVIGRTGDVYDAITGDLLGSLTVPASVGFKR